MKPSLASSLLLIGLTAAFPVLAETPASSAQAAAQAAADAALDSGVRVGRKAPDFTLTGNDDRTYRLQDMRGKWTVLTFYPADFTPGCTTEACSLRDDMSDIKTLNAKVYGISVQDLTSKKGFVEKHQLNYPLLADDKRAVAKRYDVLTGSNGVAKRYTFYLDPHGVVRKIDEKVNPATAGKDVIANLKELQRSDASPASPIWDRNVEKWEKAVKDDPKDENAKAELALAYYLKGQAVMNQPKLRPNLKYPYALKMYRAALKLDPGLMLPKEDIALIEGIYKRMGRPIPAS